MSQELITPQYSVPKALRRSFVDKNTIDSNQTYDLSESMGEQLLAKRRTSPAYKIGKEKLDGRKSSIFAAHMENKPASVRISLPKIWRVLNNLLIIEFLLIISKSPDICNLINLNATCFRVT